MFNITTLQKLWLNSRGGRTQDDVMEINGELFVAMTSRGGYYVAVIVPNDTIINKLHRVRTDAYGTRLINRLRIHPVRLWKTSYHKRLKSKKPRS